MNVVARTALQALAIAIATVIAGWWTVPVIALLWSLAAPRRAGVLSATLAAALAWSALLIAGAYAGPLGELANTLGEILGVSATALVTLTVAYAALLAGSAAMLARALRPPLVRRR